MKLLKKKFRQIKKFPTWIFFFPASLLKIMKFCMRTEIKDPCGYVNPDKPLVSVTWHNRLLFFPAMCPALSRKHTLAVVSPSRDGQYVTDLISYFGLKSLRGSSSKRAAPVLRETIKAINNGFNVSFTPDGPRGPKYKMSKGPIILASVTGSKLVPISINASSYWEIKSWDNFQIPKPWAKLTLVLGEGMEIPPDLDDEGIEKCREAAEKALMEITIDKNA